MKKLTRRQFLKWAGAAGLVTLPTLGGYRLYRQVKGEQPPHLSPYVASELTSEIRPGLPILILVDEQAANPFGIYLAEILRAEGLNCFQVTPLSALQADLLAAFDLIILTEVTLNISQMEQLTRFVHQGGALVAMRPQPEFAPLFGLEMAIGQSEAGYVQVVANHPISRGITPEALQFHGVADHYHLAGAEAVAWLTNRQAEATPFPAVTIYSAGKGIAAAWAFDLARSIVYTRQGNPYGSGRSVIGEQLIRPADLFTGWLDMDRMAIPQADEQQRFLVNLLTTISQGMRPLPRLWYFPGAAQTLFVATADSHQDPGAAVAELLHHVEKYEGHASVYYLPPLYNEWRGLSQLARWQLADLSLMDPAYLPSPEQVTAWRERGHEFTLHPLIETDLETSWTRYWQHFTALDYGPLSATARTHLVHWHPWVETARVQASYGIRLNLDFYHYGTSLKDEEGVWRYGHFTGSGRPMRFMDEQGRLLNIYQQVTHLADDHLLTMAWGNMVGLEPKEAISVSQTLLRQSLDGFYSAITAIFHADMFREGEPWSGYEAEWLDGTLAYAAAHHIPIWSAEAWLHFNEQRNGTVIEQVAWHPETGQLSFRITIPDGSETASTLLIPTIHQESHLIQVRLDEQAVKAQRQEVGGLNYGLISVHTGSHQIMALYE